MADEPTNEPADNAPPATDPVEPAGTPSKDPVDDKSLYDIFYEDTKDDKGFFDKNKEAIDKADGKDEPPPPEGDDTPKDDDKSTDDEPTLDDLKKDTELSLEFEEDTPLSDEVQSKLSELVDGIEIDDETLEQTVELIEESTLEGYQLAKEEETEQIQERLSQLKKDPLFSNTNKDETFKNMDTAVKKFGGKDAKKLEAYLGTPGVMDVTLARFLNKIGSALNEQPEFKGKTVDMKTKESASDSAEAKELAMAKKQYGVFF